VSVYRVPEPMTQQDASRNGERSAQGVLDGNRLRSQF